MKDPGAWESLVRSHAALVYTVMWPTGHEADEAFHEVWRTAWEGLGLLPDEQRLDAWLATLAVRQVERALNKARDG